MQHLLMCGPVDVYLQSYSDEDLLLRDKQKEISFSGYLSKDLCLCKLVYWSTYFAIYVGGIMNSINQSWQEREEKEGEEEDGSSSK